MKEMQNDNNGDTTHSGANSFSYDSENHLMAMNAGAVTLVYDGDGNRVAKTVGSVTTRYLVDDVNPTGLPQVVDELVGGAVTRQYTYGLDRISENQFVSGAWTPSFYGVDGGGSVRQLTNSSGTVTDSYEYDAFGNKVNSTGTTPNNYLYRGEQYDTDLSLYYLRARYYNPVSGRFLNVDSLAGHGQRRYEYAGANPVDGSDPSGNFVLASYWPLMAPLQIHFASPSWCGGAGNGPMGSLLPPCGKKHLVLDRTTFEPHVWGLHVIWTLRYNDGSSVLPDHYYVMEQQSVKWLARRQDGTISPSGRSYDYPNEFDDTIQTSEQLTAVDSLQSFQVSLSHPNYDGWAANAMHVPIRLGETEYCGDSIHLVWGGSTQRGVTCKGAQ